MTMKIIYWDNSKESEIKKVSEDRNVNVGYFNDCTIHGHSIHYPQPLIKTKNELLLPTIEKFMSLGRGTIYESTMEWECDKNEIKQVENTPVFYFVYNCANYFHWIYDTVPYLYSYFKEKELIPELKLLVSPPENNKDLYPFIYETLNLLGINKKDLIFLNKNTEYKKVIIGSSLTHNRLSLQPPHRGVFDLVGGMTGVESNHKRIYVSRRTWTQPKNENIGTDYTQQRRCINEDEVVGLAKKYGFIEVFCENYSMEEKIGLFRGAEMVMGPIGGGLSNVLFCKSETKVISLNSPEFFPINERLKHALNHTGVCMFDDTEFVGRKKDIITHNNALSISGGMNSPWRVNLTKLESVLTNLVK
jgi:hypothetical protein